MLRRLVNPLRVTPERATWWLLALAPLVYFFPAVRGRVALCPSDCLTQNLPYRVLVSKIILEGQVPLWNPYIFSGTPLLAAAQGGVLFPLNWPFVVLPSLAAINLAVVLAYILAGVGAYFYARRTGVSPFGALVTGLVWQWSGFLVAHLGHTNIIHTACLLPWVLWAIDGYAESGRRSWGVLIATLVAFQAFAGHPQAFVYSLLLAGFYAVYRALGRGGNRRRFYFTSLVMIAAGLTLAAVQILPTLELMRHSVRAAATYKVFSSYSLPPALLSLFVAPYLYGGGVGSLFRAPYVGIAYYGEYIGYVGLAALALALIVLIIKPDALTKFWGVVAFVCLALALGDFWPFGLYRLVYYVPVLNLFRVPARHLMEVDFALAVLAGRAVSAIALGRRQTKTVVVTLGVALVFVAASVLAVTWGRPHDFRLGRAAPVSVLRAPELFLPIVLAAVSAWALYRFARGRRGASPLLLAVVALDVCLWGQSGEWRQGPSVSAAPFARVPSGVAFLRRHDEQLYRVLSLDQSFDSASNSISGGLSLSAQPNMYMLHEMQNAAGYDGIELARYSRLADDMKLWGELGDPGRSLRGGREFDLLNVRYLITRRATERSSPPPPPLAATKEFGGHLFAEPWLELGSVNASARLSFTVPDLETDKLALITALSHSADAADGEIIGRVRLQTADGRMFEFALRAGIDSAEWAHDRRDVNAAVRHRRAPVAESWSVEDEAERFDGHAYVTAFDLPEKAIVIGGDIEIAPLPQSPRLDLALMRMSLINSRGSATVPLRREWFKRLPTRAANLSTALDEQRWRSVAQLDDAVVYENTRALPRVWLATEAVIVSDEAALNIIRTGRLPDGAAWNPRRTALLDSTPPVSLAGAETETKAVISSYSPGRINISVAGPAPAMLVLSENHYPGWRATVGGQPAEIRRVNYNLRGIALPPGEHEVDFIYRPSSLLLGFSLSVVTALSLLIWALFRRPN